MPWALVLALLKAGKSIAAKMAMMAMTTSNSIRVKPRAFVPAAIFILVCSMEGFCMRGVSRTKLRFRYHHQKYGVLLPVRTFDSLMFALALAALNFFHCT